MKVIFFSCKNEKELSLKFIYIYIFFHKIFNEKNDG